MKFKPDWKIIVFSLVILFAIFLRVYNFSDWLFFKMDQARDAFLIKQALELGPGWLPLLGPKAGGTDLNVGPAFYYFQYLAAVLFQSAHPAVLAFPDLLFGILSIPLFYIFAKKYFSRDWSMILAGLYSICFLGIQYSRFAWNPNGLAFFNLLYFLSLLNVFDERIRYRLRWAMLAGISLAISAQLHFLSLFTLPVITALFVIFNWREAKKTINWKYIFVFAAVVALVYLPVIFNEIVSKGENTAEFLKAFSEKPSAHSLWKNIKRDIRYWGQNWLLILVSWITKKTGVKGAAMVWLGVILTGLYLARKFYRKEKEPAKKRFLLVSILWFAVYFLVYIPIAYQIRPRFFLPLLALPFVFVGYLAVFFWDKRSKLWKACVVAALAVIFFGNLAGTGAWFREIQAAQAGPVRPWRTIILKAKDGITLWHLEKAADFVRKNCDKKFLYYAASAEYKSPFRYIFSLEGEKTDSILNYRKEKEGCFFAFGLTRSKKKKIAPSVEKRFNIVSQEKIGAISVYKLELKEEYASQEKLFEEKEEKSDRLFWKDIWK